MKLETFLGFWCNWRHVSLIIDQRTYTRTDLRYIFFKKMGHLRHFFLFFCVFNTVDSKNLPMSGIELWPTGFGSYHSANWATATAQYLIRRLLKHWLELSKNNCSMQMIQLWHLLNTSLFHFYNNNIFVPEMRCTTNGDWVLWSKWWYARSWWLYTDKIYAFEIGKRSSLFRVISYCIISELVLCKI